MQLHVGGLADSITEDELKGLFSGIGAVASVEIVKDLYSGKSRGSGIVRMPGPAGETAIKRLNGTVVRDKQITVSRMHETLPGEMAVREWLRDNALVALEKAGVSRGKTVLDYGCGPGIFTIPGARMVGKTGKIYALEVRSSALERVREKAKDEGLDNIETILSESARLTTGLANESIDVVLAYDVVQEIADKRGLLAELHRVLRPSGSLSIFPMHLGTEKMLEIMNQCPLFCFRDRYGPPGHQVVSEVINFNKC